MKNLFWFIRESISYTKGMGFKYFIKGVIPAYIKWHQLMKESCTNK